MFVRIITDRGQHEMTFECDRYTIKPVEGTFDKINVEILGIVDGGDGQKGKVLLDTQIECSGLEIITMNSNGKTVDRKVWEKPGI